jgi:hypothetical protein
MGTQRGVICRACGLKSDVSEGGGFVFHLLHCDRCGDAKSISFEEIGEPHLRYLKGLPGSYAMATRRHDEWVKKNYPGEPLSEAEYYAAVEEIVGRCECGGSYKFDVPPRCPKCRSADLAEDPTKGTIDGD